MKRIVLAKRIKRILAGLIDMVLLLGTSFSLFVFWIYPATFDRTQYLQNNHDMVQKLSDSGLYITSEEGDYSAKSRFDTVTESIESIYNVDLTFKGKSYPNNNLSKELSLLLSIEAMRLSMDLDCHPSKAIISSR